MRGVVLSSSCPFPPFDGSTRVVPFSICRFSSARCTAYPRDISLFESPFLRVSPKLPFRYSPFVAMYCLYEGHLLQISPLVFAQSAFLRVSQKLPFRCSPLVAMYRLSPFSSPLFCEFRLRVSPKLPFRCSPLVAMYCLSEGHLPFRVPFSASFAETPVSLLISAGACEMRHGRCGVRRDSAQVLSLPSHFF